VPWWAVGLLVARDLVLGATLPLLRRRGYGPYPVTYLGKGATFLLLYAFPLLLLGQTDTWAAPIALPIGLAFATWGTALYLYTGLLYLAQFVLAVRTPPAVPPPAQPPAQATSTS
jgi:cardiolipin synthase